jgi:hypothetical protein
MFRTAGCGQGRIWTLCAHFVPNEKSSTSNKYISPVFRLTRPTDNTESKPCLSYLTLKGRCSPNALRAQRVTSSWSPVVGTRPQFLELQSDKERAFRSSESPNSEIPVRLTSALTSPSTRKNHPHQTRNATPTVAVMMSGLYSRMRTDSSSVSCYTNRIFNQSLVRGGMRAMASVR